MDVIENPNAIFFLQIVDQDGKPVLRFNGGGVAERNFVEVLSEKLSLVQTKQSRMKLIGQVIQGLKDQTVKLV